MTSYRLQLRPGGIIPPAIKVGVTVHPAVRAGGEKEIIYVYPADTGGGSVCWLVDAMDGTGTLAEHVPNLNTWVIPAGDGNYMDGGITDSEFPNAALADMVLDGAGGMQMDIAAVDANGKDHLLVLQPGTPPATPDYFVETEIAMPAHSAVPLTTNLYFDISGRVSHAEFEFYANQIVCQMYLEAVADEWQVSCWSLFADWDGTSTLDYLDGPVFETPSGGFEGGLNLGTDAQTIKARVQFVGRFVECFINDVRLASWTWGGEAFDAGTAMIDFGFQNADGPLSDFVIQKIVGCYA